GQFELLKDYPIIKLDDYCDNLNYLDVVRANDTLVLDIPLSVGRSFSSQYTTFDRVRYARNVLRVKIPITNWKVR
ncbi:MAG: hypothetical protein AAFU67_14420, partial [Bacteroidota bacterium]